MRESLDEPRVVPSLQKQADEKNRKKETISTSTEGKTNKLIFY